MVATAHLIPRMERDSQSLRLLGTCNRVDKNKATGDRPSKLFANDDRKLLIL